MIKEIWILRNRYIHQFLNQSFVFYTLLLLISLAVIAGMNRHYPHHSGNFITIDSDGKGYYAYLPALISDRNIGHLPSNSSFTNEINGRNFIKYPVGVAILIAPFYFIALIYSLLFEIEAHGYSLPFQIAVQAAALFYSLLGIYFSGRLMDLYNISNEHKRISQLLLFLGTNLLYYTLFLGCLSHVYSFAAIAAFLYYTKSYCIIPGYRKLFLAAFTLGIIILIRPFNLLVILVLPFLAGRFDTLKHVVFQLLSRHKTLLVAFSIVFSVVFFQLLMWKLQTGQWLIWSYSNEGFYLNRPAILEVLLGFRKGLFIYSPLLLLVIPGFWALKKQSSFSFVSLLLFFVILVYGISSWWNWYYGDGFGHRAFIDYFSLFALIIALGIENISHKISKFFWLTFAGLALLLNWVQSYQYETDILHHHNMDAKKYAFTFLKTGASYRNLLGGNKDIKPFSKNESALVLSVSNSFEKKIENWQASHIEPIKIDNDLAGNHAVVFNQQEFGLSYTVAFDEKLSGCRKIWIEAALKRADLQPRASLGTLLVVAKNGADQQNVYYYSFPINDLPASTTEVWDTFNYSFEAPSFNEPGETLTIYLWNKNIGHFAIDDFSLKFYRIE